MLITTQGENFRPKLIEEERKKFDQGELIIKGNVKEGHRTYSAFHPDLFLELLFKESTYLIKL